MRGKWDAFSEIRTDVPSEGFEAAVFLSNARWHLINSGRSWADDELTLLIEAHRRVNEAIGEIAA
jgi:hypothetical protein